MHRGTVNFLSEVGSELQLKANTAQAAPSSSLMLSTGSDNVVKVWDLKRMKAVSEINTAGWGSLTKAVWAGPAVVACTNSGSVRLLQYAPSLAVAVAVPVMSNGADAAAVAAGMQFADDASISSLQGGKADWTSKEMGAHGQACTDLLSTRSFVASASKSGQIFKWIRL